MHPVRKQRLMMVVWIVMASSVAVGLLAYALSDNINLFYTPTQIANGEAAAGSKIRVGGMVVPGSVVRDAEGLGVNFQVTDGEAQVGVYYQGILPDLFAENAAAVATGTISAAGIFEASEVLAKHDENYMPPEVQEAMDAAHQRAKAREASGYEGQNSGSSSY